MSRRPIQYRITVRGRVAPHWSRWLGKLQLSYRTAGESGTVTDLNGTLTDQSALQGALNRIWNLNLTVLSVSTSADAHKEGEPAGPGGEPAPARIRGLRSAPFGLAHDCTFGRSRQPGGRITLAVEDRKTASKDDV